MRRSAVGFLLAAVIAAAALVTTGEASEPYVYQPVPQASFRAITPVRVPVLRDEDPQPTPSPTPKPTPKPSPKPQPKRVSVRAGARLAKSYARSRVGSTQFRCLDRLWTRESGWRWNADNPTSTAYGIPQALPGSKMRTAGRDWRTNPITQVKWGLRYISGRYGSACKAWQHSQLRGWY